MKLKSNFHFHTAEDPEDLVDYTLKEGIDHVASLGFDVLAVTCHNYFAWTRPHDQYARERGILLVPGIELTVNEEKKYKRTGHKKGYHVLVLNADKEAEEIHTFDELREYKEKRGDEIAIVAAHPYFYGNFSLKEHLEKYIDLFDAIEHSWFYSRIFNRNIKGLRAALKFEKPFLATSDTHYFRKGFMDRNYAILITDEKTVPAVINAIKNGDFENMSKPSNTFFDMFLFQGTYQIIKTIKKIFRKI